MGQYFQFFNFTKKERVNFWGVGGLAKKVEIEANDPKLQGFLKSTRWKGDRVELIGDYDRRYRQLRETFKDVTSEIREGYFALLESMGKEKQVKARRRDIARMERLFKKRRQR